MYISSICPCYNQAVGNVLVTKFCLLQNFFFSLDSFVYNALIIVDHALEYNLIYERKDEM